MIQSRILIIEFDKDYRQMLRDSLQEQGHLVFEASQEEEALAKVESWPYEVIILDLDMLHGLELLQQIALRVGGRRILAMATQITLSSAVQALHSHVYDLLQKPLSFVDLNTSIAATFKENLPPAVLHVSESKGIYEPEESRPAIQHFDGVSLDLKKRTLQAGMHTLALTPTEVRILEVLADHYNEVVVHEELIFRAQGYVVDANEAGKILRPAISRLRQKLMVIAGGESWIQNIRGSGYLLKVPNLQI